jgi:AMP deaminase
MAEYRISIYGKSRKEWEKMAAWFQTYKIRSPNVVWLIQIPRLYHVYKKSGVVFSFGEMLRNIFEPIFEASMYPEQFPELNALLSQVVGFDTVDDESIREKVISFTNYKEVVPEDWSVIDNPPYSYWSYYFYSNIVVLNHLRKAKGLNPFAFRPHCGEAGVSDHLAVAFLTAHGINHGI